MRFTDKYAQLQRDLHAKGGYGVSGHKHADRVIDFAKRMNTREVLDYGCGQMTLAKALPFSITNYDPFVAGCETEPEMHDLVVCSDMLEHVEPELLDEVLSHIHSKTRKLLFIDVACRPAKKTLADGRNAHLIQSNPRWWLSQLGGYFDPQSFQVYEGGFVGVFTPFGIGIHPPA